jgi:hypothetical protein
MASVLVSADAIAPASVTMIDLIATMIEIGCVYVDTGIVVAGL